MILDSEAQREQLLEVIAAAPLAQANVGQLVSGAFAPLIALVQAVQAASVIAEDEDEEIVVE